MASHTHLPFGISPFILALIAGVLWMANSGEALTCFNCEFTECSTKPLKCPYGIAKDVCGCCDVCANGVGEECGGESGILGRCGKGLRCDRRPRNNEALPPEMTEGICVQDSTPTPPRRETAVSTKWRKLGEECGGRRGIYGKCIKGLRCDRSPRGNEETPITQRRGVCAPLTSNAEPARKGSSSIRPDSDKASKRARTTPSPKQEPENSLNALYVPKEAPPIWYVRASWLQRRREAIERDRQETARQAEVSRRAEKKRSSRWGRPREATGHLRYD